MTDRLAELGALQYAVENLSTAGTNPNRLGLAGYIHAAYTDYQTWAAANPGVNPNRLSARGRLYGYFYDNASWSPSSLFASSEVGAWYDPSDLSTMFQDSAGATPVTADGQPVGLILDKSQGQVLGPELVTNGDLLSVDGLTASCSDATPIITLCSVVGGMYYEMPYVALSKAQYCSLRIDGTNSNIYPSGIGFTPTTALYGTYRFRALVSGTLAIVTDNTGVDWVFDSISVKELPGNHASQATAASRPLYKTDGTYHWLQFDGVDDSLSTAAIDFTSTDKMSVFSGLLNNASDTTFVSLGVDLFSDGFYHSGSVQVSTLPISDRDYAYYTTMPATDNIVTAYVMDRSGANAAAVLPVRRVNQANDSTNPLTQGTGTSGNFANSTLKVGNRTDNINYYAGNIYSLIIRGALSTTQEITDTETWVNSKCGAF